MIALPGHYSTQRGHPWSEGCLGPFWKFGSSGRPTVFLGETANSFGEIQMVRHWCFWGCVPVKISLFLCSAGTPHPGHLCASLNPAGLWILVSLLTNPAALIHSLGVTIKRVIGNKNHRNFSKPGKHPNLSFPFPKLFLGGLWPYFGWLRDNKYAVTWRFQFGLHEAC